MINAEPVADIDLAIDRVLMFRLERMDDGVIWIRLYRENGEDKVIWLNSPSAISTRVEDDKDPQSDAEPDPNLPDPNFDPAEAAQVDARSIEEANAQFDAEPVAWQWRVPGKDWPELSCGKDHAEYMRSHGAEIRPVFASPRPDASAGLIEAAERTLKRCRTVLAHMALENEGGGIFTARWPIHHEPLRGDAKHLLPIIDEVLCALDADRSGE